MLKKILITLLALGLTVGFAGEVKGKAVKAKKGDLAAGKKVFDTYCLICHGATGQGDGVGAAALNPKPRKFGDTAYMTLQTREKLRGVVVEGGKFANLSPLMGPWKAVLKKENEIDNVVAYLLRFSEDSAKAVAIAPPGREIDKVKPKEAVKGK